MIVVADSGPPHYLILLGHIELLHRFYGQVAIPEAVANELRAAGSPAAVNSWIARPPEWVVVIPVPQDQMESITDDLDLGERAAIALAGTIRADLLLIDDAAGRVEARRRNLRVTGTLGVLRAGAEQGIIDVPDTVSKLRSTSFYVDDALINTIFARWLRP
jgi:predicted nucleic acid-binding protein